MPESLPSNVVTVTPSTASPDWDLSCGPPRTGLSDSGATLFRDAGGYIHVKALSCTDNATGQPVNLLTGNGGQPYGVEIGLSQGYESGASYLSAAWMTRPALSPPDGEEGLYARLYVPARLLAPGPTFAFVRVAGSVVAPAGAPDLLQI